MRDSDRILAAYEHGLKKLADELIADLDPPEEERVHLLLVSQMVQALIHTYDSFQMNRAPGLEASRSVMYAAAGQHERRVLNVPLRSLVEAKIMTPWHARYLSACLGMKRTVIVTGEENVGKSTLLNALIGLLARDQRIVVIDDIEDNLPAVRGRSFTVQVKAKQGASTRPAAFQKGADMKPNWLVVGELGRRDGPGFFQALSAGSSGLASVRTPDPEAALTDWMALSRETPAHMAKLEIVIVHVVRDQAGRPTLDRMAEVTVEDGRLVLTARRPT